MTLNDLKTGMIVTNRKGEEMLVLLDVSTQAVNSKHYFVDLNKNEMDGFNCYNDDMTNKFGKTEFDIVKVEKVTNPVSSVHPDYDRRWRKVIWERNYSKKLTVAEIEKLLGYKVEIVSEEE